MKQHIFKDWLVPLSAVMLVAGGVAAGSAGAAPATEKVKAQIQNGVLNVSGTSAGEEIVLRLRSGDPTMLEVVTDDGIVGHNLRRDRFESIVVRAGDGNDLVRIDEVNGVFTDVEATTLAGGGGNDDLRGGSRVETFDGGPGNDQVDGNQGNEIAFLGSGDDSFTWDPGDGSDIVEGQDGSDTLVFNGSGGSENFDASANGQRLRFFRSAGNIVMDVDDTERIDLRVLGGADNTVMNDLSATDVVDFDIDLASSLGGSSGDGSADTVTLNGNSSDEAVAISGQNGSATTTGLSALARITNAEAATDVLVVNGLGGDDTITAATLAASAMKLTLDGASDDDVLFGGAGVDQLLGGSGDDKVDGNQGNDVASLGSGDDSFIWDPGDASDIVEGQDGSDTLVFNGSGGNEAFVVSAVGPRVEFLRNLGTIDMDLNGVERIDLNALGGTDTTTVNDLTGTDVKDVNIDLEGVLGGGAPDGAADIVTVSATPGVDVVDIFAVDGETLVTGLAADVRIAHSDPAFDQLVVNTLAGLDQVTVDPDVAALIAVTVND